MRITVIRKVDRPVRTARGVVQFRAWCEMEAKRLAAKGINARVVTANGRCWVEVGK
ncbi:MAG: hypothetical protein QXS54_02965 [Candidatus Methanomethylicaceae archaeon]